MLRIIDQRWREHLEEMDYLQEGINLRADGPEGPAHRVAARGLRDVRPDDEGHRPGLRQVRHARAGGPQGSSRSRSCRTCSRPPATTCQTDGFAAAAAALPRQPARSSREAAASGRGAGAGQAADRRQGRVVEDAAQRAVPVRQRQEVQDVPRRKRCELDHDMRDFSDDLKELRRRLGEAEGYLKIDANRARLAELEIEVSRPDLWDDQDAAKKINAEYSNVKSDIDTFDALSGELEDAELLHEMAREVDDESQEPDIDAAVAVDRPRSSPARPAQPVHRRARRSRLHRADQRQGRRRRRPGLGRDPAAHVQPLGRAPRLRARDRRDQPGRRGRHHVGRVHAHRSLRLRPDDRRARHAPPGAHQPVRQPGPPPDQLRRRAGVAGDGRARRRDQRDRHRACRCSGPAAPAVSTSTRRRRRCA